MLRNKVYKYMGVVTDYEWVVALGEKYPDWRKDSPDTLKRNQEFSDAMIKNRDKPELAVKMAQREHISRISDDRELPIYLVAMSVINHVDEHETRYYE